MKTIAGWPEFRVVIDQRRSARSMSLNALARAAQIPPSTLQTAMGSANITLHTLTLLMRALDLSWASLIKEAKK